MKLHDLEEIHKSYLSKLAEIGTSNIKYKLLKLTGLDKDDMEAVFKEGEMYVPKGASRATVDDTVTLFAAGFAFAYYYLRIIFGEQVKNYSDKIH